MELSKTDREELIKEKITQIDKQYGKSAKLLVLEIINLQKDLVECPSRRIPLPDFNLYHRKPTVSAIRNYIANRQNNGLEKSGALIKQGKLWELDENKFFKWYENRGLSKIKSVS